MRRTLRSTASPGADDYYRRASSLGYLGGIAAPTLCLSAEDDPFLPRETLARARAAARRASSFIVTERGGHIGFVGGWMPWRPSYWAEVFAVDWLEEASRSRVEASTS